MGRLDSILDQLQGEEILSDQDIGFLLSRSDQESMDKIFSAARKKRAQYFGDKIYMYGFVYFSTYCQNNCSFCYFRKENDKPPRYRKSVDQIVCTARELANSGVGLIDLTTGDDPYYTRHPERLAEIIRRVRKETGLAIMCSPGVLDQQGIDLIAAAGADWYALYQETHNRSLYDRLRLDQSYDQRIDAKRYAASRGLLLEEGLLVGVGDTIEDRVVSFHQMKKLGTSQVRTMTFVPQDGAPLSGENLNGSKRELMTIAVMRLLFPDELIPASLDVEGLDGLYDRLQAGANVVTSIIPPREGYAGVANSVQDIDEGYRTVKGIQATLGRCGLSPASAREYRDWLDDRKRKIQDQRMKEEV
ncbi:MAG: methylornithine synthase PylB [Lachnospiraceae bacterium]|nr:methylornithine synthase PylB [Lachnospiraceae bacterium]